MSELNSLEINKRGRRFTVINCNNSRTFWELLQNDGWEETTFSILDEFVTKDVRYIDIGCWIGPTVLYAAQAASSTYAFEPDPIAYKEMESNLLANSSQPWASGIHLVQKAVAPSSGTIELGSRGDGGDSTSSALFADGKTKWTVDAVKLPDFLASRNALGGKTFLKIDIEGGEFALIPALNAYLRSEDVTLLISIHTHFLARALTRRSDFLGKVQRRLALTSAHWRLFRQMPFKHFYRADGTPISLGASLLTLFITGRFPMEILALNSEWRAERHT
jgi:FkbM family methyltransferase